MLCTPKLPAVAAHYEASAFMSGIGGVDELFPTVPGCCACGKRRKQMMCAAAIISTISTQNLKFHCWIRWWLEDPFPCAPLVPLDVVARSAFLGAQRVWMPHSVPQNGGPFPFMGDLTCEQHVRLPERTNWEQPVIFSCYFETCFSMKITTSPKTSVAW